MTPVPGPRSGTRGEAGEASDALSDPHCWVSLGLLPRVSRRAGEKCQNQIREARGWAFKQKPGVSVQSSSALWERRRTSRDPPDPVHLAPRGQLGNMMARQCPVPTGFRPDPRAFRRHPGRGLGWGRREEPGGWERWGPGSSVWSWESCQLGVGDGRGWDPGGGGRGVACRPPV